MRHALLTIVLALAFLTPPVGAEDSPPAVSLFRSGEKELTVEAKTKLATWSVELLKTANFNTANQPKILKQSVSDIQKHYRKTVRGDYLDVAYDHAITIKTSGGNVSVAEIIIGLNRPDDVNSALFTVDSDGRVVAHEMYGHAEDGKNIFLPDELQPKLSMTETDIAETSCRIGILFGQQGHLPPDLSTLPVRKGYANRATDAWDRPLMYSVNSADGFTLSSFGRDGVVGGQGEDADVVRRFRIKIGVVEPVP